MLPLFGLAGNMGAGKSSVAKIMREDFGFLEVSQAEPMKEIAAEVFGFDAEALWGPTSERNKLRTGGVWEEPMFWDETMLMSVFEKHRIITPVEANEKRVIDIFNRGWELIEAFYHENGGKLNARYPLQILGTEIGRAIRTTIWTDRAVERCLEQLMLNCPDAKTLPGAVISDVRFRSELLTLKRNGAFVVKIVDPNAGPAPENEHISESELRGIPDFWFDSILENPKKGVDRLEMDIQFIMKNWTGLNPFPKGKS